MNPKTSRSLVLIASVRLLPGIAATKTYSDTGSVPSHFAPPLPFSRRPQPTTRTHIVRVCGRLREEGPERLW